MAMISPIGLETLETARQVLLQLFREAETEEKKADLAKTINQLEQHLERKAQ
jgi:hypothetical protein